MIMFASTSQGFSTEELPGVGAIPEADWARLFPDEAEGWAYYRAVEASPPPGFCFEALAVRGAASRRIVAAAPLFRVTYRLDTPLQGGMRPIGDWLHRALPRLVAHPVLGLGSPLADRCHLGLDPSLTPPQRLAAAKALLDGLDAKAARENVRILAVKDIAERDAAPLHDTFSAAGYSRIAGLPVCVLDLPFENEAAYIQSLSANNRSVLRRKLKTAGPVAIETVTSIAGIEDEIFSLYEETRANSRFDYGDFEQLSPAYFRDVVAALGPGRASVILARGDGRLLAMKLLFIEKERIIDKFWGMRYPAGRDHNLFFVCWMEGVRFALRHGARQYQSGQTAYAQKVKLGSRLDPMWVYFRHRWPLVNRVFRRIAPLVAFDRLDPELAEIRKRKSG
ncbi:MAG: GNAT family N-acetyltransferase [Hyphomicrobiaceae bacterium]